MQREAPFDVWDGEELGLHDEVVEDAAEEVAMHLDPESEIVLEPGPHWSELTDGDEAADADSPVCCYFADEHPELIVRSGNGARDDELEVSLADLLVRQHYAFPD